MRLRWNNNRRQLLTLRARSPQAQPVLSVHYRMPQYGLQFEDLIDWLRGGQLPAKVREIFATWDANRSLAPRQEASISAPALRQDWPLTAVGQAVADRWFADLSPVTFSWSRGSKGALRSIRLAVIAHSQSQPFACILAWRSHMYLLFWSNTLCSMSCAITVSFVNRCNKQVVGLALIAAGRAGIAAFAALSGLGSRVSAVCAGQAYRTPVGCSLA